MPDLTTSPVLLLGVGPTALAYRRLCGGSAVRGTSRAPADARFETVGYLHAHDEDAVSQAAHHARVLVSIPPDGSSDFRYASLVKEALQVVYLSSTGVYPADTEHVDESSAVATSGTAVARLEAEHIWRSIGASVVRLPALYGTGTGLHVRLQSKTFRMPAGGANYVSRIHLEDAARFVNAAFTAPPASTLLAGDAFPAQLCDVVSFVCDLFNCPRPDSVPLEQAPPTLRGNRKVDSSATRRRFGIELAYPSYREGFRAIFEASRLDAARL